MKTDSPVAKIQEFDILRALAILMLMFHHSEAYGLSLSGIPLEGLTPYIEGILLGIFFFISGYFAKSSFQKQNKGSIPFFFCRMLRIYPPYLLGLFLYMFVLGISFKKRDLIIYLTGTHFIFAPNFAKPVITIWYIGAIILFYLIFGVLLANLRTTRSLVIGSAVIFTAAYALHQWTGLLDGRFFKYFIVFLAGIIFARPQYLSNWLTGKQVLLKLALAIPATFVFSRVLDLGSTSPLYIFGVVLFILSWVILLFSLASRMKAPFLLKLAGIISYTSYFAYLLHRPLWEWLTNFFSVETFQSQVFFRMIPASVVVFILSYYLQYGYDRLLAVFRRNE